MTMRHSILSVLAITSLLSISSSADAHRTWIKPSTTNLSGESPWVTFDAAVSNTLFVPEHFPLPLKGLNVVNPTGKLVEVSNLHKGKYRSTFDLNLATQGTYKIGFSANGLRASWKDAEGKSKRWPGRGKTGSAAEFASAVPKNAEALNVYENYWRVETFVTSGEPTKETLKASNIGLELIADTHPNDLFAGETAKFRLMFQGEPAVGATVSVVAGHMRYRNQQDQLDMVTDSQGYININWPYAGMFLLEAEFKDDKAQAPATSRRGSYSATFEVLPL